MAKHTTIQESKIISMMKCLNCTREEAIDVIECDQAIDRGERVEFDFSKEKEKEILREAHKGTGRERSTNQYTFKPRQRKPNDEKAAIIGGLENFLATFGVENLETTNKEREISFSIGENHYSVTLIQHRPAKKE